MRVPLSWLNEFLPRPMSAREVDDALGEAGITVTVIDAPGRLSPRVVAGRVRTTDGTEPVVDLPTPERVSLPGGGACPPPGTMVAVALPGSRLLAVGPPGDEPSRHGLTTVPPPKRDGDPVGRLCTPAELGTGPDDRGYCVLPDTAEPGVAVAAVTAAGGFHSDSGCGSGSGGEEILHLTVPDALAHCGGLWGLAYEIGSREGMPGAARSHDDRTAPVNSACFPALSVPRPDWTVSAVLVPAPSTGPLPGPLLARMTLAGIGTSDVVTDALNIAAYEYGTRLAVFPVPGTAPVGVVVGAASGANPEPKPEQGVRWPTELPVRLDGGAAAGAAGDTPRLLVLSACRSVLDADGDRCAEAARRAAHLLSDAAVQGVHTASGPSGARRRIALDVAAVRAALGLDLTTDSCTALLARIGARASRTEGEMLDVSLPPSRTELRTAADLVSEVMRLHGYRALPATTPTDPVTRHRDPRGPRLRALRDAMAVRGFQEALTPLVLDPGTVTAGTSWCEPAVHLEQNGAPLPRTLRRSLVPGLLAVAGGALRHGPRCAVFETGTVVRPEHSDRALGGEEDAFTVLRAVPADGRVAGAETGAESRAEAVAEAVAEENLREVGAAVRAAVRAAGVTRFELRPADLPGFRPGTGAVILTDGVEVGGLGILSGARGPAHQEVAVAEIDLTLLLRLPHAHRTLSAPPRHPAVELDVNLLVPDEVPSGELPRALRAGSPLVRSARVSDVYRGRGIPPGHRAITVTLGFASPWRTLTRGEATTACAQAVAAVEPLGVRRR